MRTASKVLKTIAAAAAVLLAIVVVREAFFSPISYFVIVPGAKVFTDGKSVAGWLHRGAKGHSLILTRTVSGKSKSYWISLLGERGGWVGGCGGWAASRFPLVAVGDVYSPFIIPGDEPLTTNPPKPAPIFGTRSVEFTAEDGERIKAVW